jgi:hypothetical protein
MEGKMESNIHKTKKVFALILGFLVFLHPWLFPENSRNQDREECLVKETLKRFKDGIEKGELETGSLITTKEFYPFFKGFYESLAKGYSQYKISFPMEIGHLKILKSALAKVELFINPAKNLFVFTLKKEGGQWKIVHNEGIRFPLYSIPELPTEEFYTIPAEKRSFMNAEMDLNFKTRVYFYLKKHRGEEKASAFFLDGPGYKVAMEAWLPFLEGAAQFAFYFAIMETNFFGSSCEIIRADYDEAEVLCSSLAALEVLKRGHAVPKFSYEEYIRLYTAILKHRAQHCGLDVKMSFEDSSLRLIIKKN